MKKYKALKYVLAGIIICFFLTANIAAAGQLRISNVRGTQFNVSWTTEEACKGMVAFFQKGQSDTIAYDDRGDDYVGTTHFITIKHLEPDTIYLFEITSGANTDDNEGSYYSVNTGPALIPRGSLQPAGRIFQKDGKTPAKEAIVYISVHGGAGSSGSVATLSDENGYWYTDLVNCRTPNAAELLSVSPNDVLEIEVEGGNMGSATLTTVAIDNNGGTDLRPSIILE